MPEALSDDRGPSDGESSWDRSRPLVFLGADFAFLTLDRPGVLCSSSASRVSRSAFLRACSAFLAASASLKRGREAGPTRRPWSCVHEGSARAAGASLSDAY